MLPNGPYNFTEEEARILDYWLQNGFYKPEYDPKQGRVVSTEEMKKDSRAPWSLICPPPNAYGRPHIGNLSGYAYQDAMARYARMQGKKVLMIPGKDHAGLEGEGVFVRDVLEKQGRSKFDMTREEFYKEIWDFNMKNMQLALEDEKSIGLSADFDRNIFTLDPKIVDTVLSTFVQMYNEQMIYKGVRIVNWDPKARSAVADNQCIREERDGTLYTIKYPLVKQRAWKLNFRKSEILERIITGQKTIETRALNPEEPERYFGDINNGDILICVDKSGEEKMSVYKKVKRFYTFQNIGEAFSNLDWKNIFDMDWASELEVRNAYSLISEGYLGKIENHGLAVIELEDLNDSDYITIATTRPETIPADTAIAMNPEDERYKEFRNFKAIIPFTDREVPIISSFRVDKDFGTGCLKVTPAHAIDDYLIMQEWNSSLADSQKISYINVIGQDLKLCGPVPNKYKGRKYKEAKADMVNELKDAVLLINEEAVKQNVLIAERTKAQIEPLISSQWFVDIEKIRKPVIDMVKNGEVTIHPKNMEQKFYHWMENLRDWAISRSLWWGYRMPVWYAGQIEERIDDDGKVETWIKLPASSHELQETSNRDSKLEARSEESEAVPLDPTNPNHMRVQLESPGESWIQDENVLDTWFSSGQWPYATLGAFNLMDTFYPTDVMDTAFDILENWVSRMMMFSYIKLKTIPFKDVFLNGLVLGPDGQKMSKSRGNLVNIDDAKRDYGTDAIRMVYFYQNKAGSDYTMSNDKLKNFKQFMNKIWNASRFVLMNQEAPSSELRASKLETHDSKLDLSKQILSHITDLKEKVTKNIESFEFGYATESLYESFWHTFCDIYLEEAKMYLYAKKDKETGQVISEPDEASKIEIQQVLMYALKEYLKMLHPFIPFITQRIWNEVQRQDDEHECLMYTSW